MAEQVNLFGETGDPADLELGRAQRAVLEALRNNGALWDDEAGAVIHAKRGKHDVYERCGFCQEDGAAVLDRLHEARPLVRTPDGRRRLSVAGEHEAQGAAGSGASGGLQPRAHGVWRGDPS